MRKALLALLLTGCASQPVVSPAPAVNPAVAAAIERAEGLVRSEPRNMVYKYVLATYYDGARDAGNVVRVLTHLDQLGWDLGLGPDSFPNTSSNAAFQQVAKELQAREKEVLKAEEAFKFSKELKVDSEGIAYDEAGKVLYLSGERGNLLRVDRSGNMSVLLVKPVGNHFQRLGMDVDARRRQIWVISAVFSPDAGLLERGRSALSVYDLRDGSLLREVVRGSAEDASFMNDLTLTEDGTAYITDTGRNQVLRLGPGSKTFEVFASDLRGPNGIALSADERQLYVADFRGISRFDVATRAGQLIEANTLLNGIDGLLEYRGSLIGIQNVLGRPRVVRIHVEAGNRVELLESGNPLLNVPTTGVVAGDEYFFIANPSPKDVDRVVLKIPLVGE